MDPLADDPRTAGMDYDVTVRRQLAKAADRLLAALEPSETASWAVLSTGMSPVYAVLTDQRLLLLPPVDGLPTQSIGLPFRVELGKKRLLGQSLEVIDSRGVTARLFLSASDMARILNDDNATTSTTRSATAESETPEAEQESAHDGTPSEPAAGDLGSWQWGRPILDWRDAELMAAAHMMHLGFVGTTVTAGGADSGIDVIADSGAAQVKYHAAPTGSPDVQRLFGAANGFAHRLFYATGYTPAAVDQAERLDVKLFLFTAAGLVVPYNPAAESLAPNSPATKTRGLFGQLTFESRQNRAVGWARQIEAATRVPISNRKRKGARQLTEREQALTLMLRGLEELKDSDNPLYKQRRKERTLAQAEKTLKEASRLVRLVLK